MAEAYPKLTILIILFVFLIENIFGQHRNSPAPFNTYYYDYKLANPAFVGTKGKHVITTSYAGAFFNSYHGAPHVFYGAYEANLKTYNTGIGGLLVYDELGPTTYVSPRILYSRKLSFNETSGLRLGTQLLYQNLKTDYAYYEPIFPGDPVIGDDIRKQQSINLDIGLAYYSSILTLGAAVKNILRQEPADNTSVNLILTREFKFNDWLKVDPSIFFQTDFNDKRIDVNGAFEIKRWILLGAGYTFPENGDGNLTFNVGLDIKGWVQIITHVYSTGNEWLRKQNTTRVESIIRVTIPSEWHDKK